jgi:hypothetical protein
MHRRSTGCGWRPALAAFAALLLALPCGVGGAAQHSRALRAGVSSGAPAPGQSPRLPPLLRPDDGRERRAAARSARPPPPELLQPRYHLRIAAGGGAALRALCAEAAAARRRAPLAGACDWSAAAAGVVTFTPRGVAAAAVAQAALLARAAGAAAYVETAALLAVPEDQSASSASAPSSYPPPMLNTMAAAPIFVPPEPPPVPSAEWYDRLALREALLPQPQPPWHLDRVDQAALPLDSSYDPPGAECGAGAHLFVLDTGLVSAHAEFTGRIGSGFCALPECGNGGAANSTEDCHGHGTHCAGVAAGASFGVAKCATLHAVRVFSCDGWGSTQAVLSGLAWVAQQAAALRPAPSVLSMSVGGPLSLTVNDAVAALVDAGVTVVTSAGNAASDACLQSPASARGAIAVGATNASDARAAFSNGKRSRYGYRGPFARADASAISILPPQLARV